MYPWQRSLSIFCFSLVHSPFLPARIPAFVLCLDVTIDLLTFLNSCTQFILSLFSYTHSQFVRFHQSGECSFFRSFLLYDFSRRDVDSIGLAWFWVTIKVPGQITGRKEGDKLQFLLGLASGRNIMSCQVKVLMREKGWEGEGRMILPVSGRRGVNFSWWGWNDDDSQVREWCGGLPGHWHLEATTTLPAATAISEEGRRIQSRWIQWLGSAFGS